MPFILADDGLRVSLRVTPRASRNAITGIGDSADGPRLKVSVTAAPEAGKANAAVVKLLAKAWRVPKSRMDLVAGATDRNKLLLIRHGDKDLMDRLAKAIAKDTTEA
jgi:uncharacterized protein (TIGR00251 family)